MLFYSWMILSMLLQYTVVEVFGDLCQYRSLCTLTWRWILYRVTHNE